MKVNKDAYNQEIKRVNDVIANRKEAGLDITAQINYLNKLVLDYCVPNVLTEVEQYLGYLDAVQKLPNPLPLPENLSSAGTKTLRSVTTTF